MIGKIKVGLNYVLITIASTKGDGDAVDPTTPTATVCLLSQANGTLSPISGSPFNMVKLQSETGWFGYALAMSALAAGQYQVLVKAVVDAKNTIWTDAFFIDAEQKKIADNLDVVLSTRASDSDMTTLIANIAAYSIAWAVHEVAQATHRKYMTSRAGQELAIQFKQYGQLNDVEIFRGDKAEIYFALVKDGAALDITGATVHLAAKKNIDDAVCHFDVECTITDEEAGLCWAYLSDTETGETCQLIAEVEIVWPTGPPSTYGQFFIYIKKDIRKPAP